MREDETTKRLAIVAMLISSCVWAFTMRSCNDEMGMSARRMGYLEGQVAAMQKPEEPKTK